MLRRTWLADEAVGTRRRRLTLDSRLVGAFFIAVLGAFLVGPGSAAAARTEDHATTLTVRLVTVGAAGGPFEIELTDAVPEPAVRQGAASTTAAGSAVDVAGLAGDVAPGIHTLRQDSSRLPVDPGGGSWGFTRVECDGARVEVNLSAATATITVDVGTAPTCVVTDTFVAAAALSPAATTTTTPTAAPAATSATPTTTVAPPVAAAAAPAAAVAPIADPPLDCSGDLIYQIQRPTAGTTSGKLNAVAVGAMTGTTPIDATQVIPSDLLAAGGNALGVTAGGTAAWALAPQTPGGTGATLDFTPQSFDPGTGAWTSHTASIDTTGRLPAGVTAQSIRDGGIVAGAIDPLSGNFYWASLANAPVNSLTLFGWNTTTNTPIGVVANSTLPQTLPPSGSTNGDIAFDRGGNLYVVSNSGTNAALGVIQGPLPTTQPAVTPTLTNTRLTTFANGASNSFNGIAFNGTGDLFIQWSTSAGGTVIQKVDPSTGAILAGPSTVNFTPAGGGVGVDLGACSAPPTLELQKDVVNRQRDTDQFTLSITGDGLTPGAAANTTATTGAANGVQTETAGPVVARAGTTYTFTETAAGTTTLTNYTTTFECVDQGAGDAVVLPPTPGQTFTVTPAAGQAILCTFTNSAPRLVLAKTSAVTAVVPGTQVPYTLMVTNTGSQPATNVMVTDNLPLGLSFVSSTPVCTATGQLVTCSLGTIAAGATVPVQLVTLAADPFPPSAIDPSGTVVNAARVTSPGTNCPPSSADPACIDEVPLPVPTTVRIVKSSTATQIRSGTQVPYAITVTNTGPAPATNVVVTDTLPIGLSFVSSTPPCAAVGQVVTCNLGTIAAGAPPARIDMVTMAASPFPPDAVDPTGKVVNAATVTSPNTNCPPGSTDPNCRDSVPLPIERVADVRVTKAVDRTQITVDPSSDDRPLLTYTLTVTNAGPDHAIDVVVTDTLPIGTEFVSDAPSVGTCNLSDATLTCALGELVKSATVQIVVTVAVPPTHPGGTLSNGVVVTTSTPDPDPANNRAEASTTVQVSGTAVAGAALAATGTQIDGPLLLGAVLIGTGGLAISLGRRRRRSA